jgi:hypothetical protein
MGEQFITNPLDLTGLILRGECLKWLRNAEYLHGAH